MKPKMIIAILVMTAVPVYAQAQTPSKVDAEKVVKIISGDKAKTRIYCQMDCQQNRLETLSLSLSARGGRREFRVIH